MHKDFVCTKENPYSILYRGYATHPDAVEIYSDWDYTEYKCPTCKSSWKEYWEDMK